MKKSVMLGIAISSVVCGGCTVREGRGHDRPYGGRAYGGSMYAGPMYGMAGCGLGAVIFGPDNTPGAQLLAATTNGTFGTQTSGITSGTSNCEWGGIVRAEREQAAFAEVNFDDIKTDMAAGGGEFLSSFSELLGCDERVKPTLFALMQARYATLVPSDESSPGALVVRVKTLIRSDSTLSSACSDDRAIARAEGRGGAIQELRLARATH